MSVVVRKIMEGMGASICALGTDDDCPTLDFLGDLASENGVEYGKIWALLERTKDHGPPRNKEKCRALKGTDLFEFKTGGGVRITWFWDAGKMIICTHGFMKKAQKREIKKAELAKKTYLAAKAAGKLRFVA